MLSISGSDDFTLFLWEPSTQKQPKARMTGHMQLINQVTCHFACTPALFATLAVHCLLFGLLSGVTRAALQVTFSPDGRYIASASFDKSVKVWDGLSGTFVATLRGHVGPVYQVDRASTSTQTSPSQFLFLLGMAWLFQLVS
jgi:ribosome assembly protein 4